MSNAYDNGALPGYYDMPGFNNFRPEYEVVKIYTGGHISCIPQGFIISKSQFIYFLPHHIADGHLHGTLLIPCSVFKHHIVFSGIGIYF